MEPGHLKTCGKMKVSYSYIFAYGCTSMMLLMGQCLSEFLSVSSLQNGETLGDFIRFDYSPNQVLDNSPVRVHYQCTSPCQVAVDVVVYTSLRTRQVVFRREWLSNEHHGGPGIIQVQLRFPPSVLYRQDLFNRHVLDARSVVVRAWLGHFNGSNEPSTYSEALARTCKVLQTVALSDRPSKMPIECPSWSAELQWQMTRDRIHQCPHESGTAYMLKFPLASTGERFGVVRQFQPFINRELERTRLSAVKQPKVALSVWFYLMRWCHRDRCGIIHHVDRNNEYDTILMQLTDNGGVIFQVRLTTGEDRAFRAHVSLPVRTWVRLDCYIQDSKVTLQTSWNNETSAYIYQFKSTIHYDDTNGYFVIGGSKYVPGIYGYFGTIKYYRFGTQKVKNPLNPKNILENLEKAHSECMQIKRFTKAFFHEVNKNYFFLNKDFCSHQYITRATCRQTWPWEMQLKYSILFNFLRRHEDYFRTGSWGVHTAKHLSKQLLRYAVSIVFNVDHTDIQVTPTLKALLEASSCFGNHRASLLLATLHLAGLGGSVDQQQGHVYGLIGALGDNRLALMHMGYKHQQGLDGFPEDLDMSLCYYANIGAQSASDHFNMQEEQQYQLEDFYLSDKEALKRLNNGKDMVDFLKFQAERGDLQSQKLLGSIIFWGANGITKDIGEAAKWMKTRAMHMDDPTAMHDYSIALLKGQGVEKNVTLAFQLLEKAAAMGSVDALNCLGWYHSFILKDHRTAVKYFEQAALNGSKDGMFNLGVYHMMNGTSPEYPLPKKTETAAFQLFLNASRLGHVQASVKVAWYLATGSLEGVSRDTKRAVIMLKNVSEKNGHLGYMIRKALHAYLDGSWHVAFVLYAIGSETGLGLAQANTAQLCEELKLSNECQWRYYNYSTLSYNPHPSALLKMGDHYYFSSSNRKDSLSLVGQAISMYSRAALAGSPQGLYNLADLAQKGHVLPPSIQRFFNLTSLDELNVVTEKLLERCVEIELKEDITVCSLVLLRLQMEKALRKMMLNDAQLLLVYASLVSFIIIIINVPMEILLEHLWHDTEQRDVNRRPAEQTARSSAVNQADVTYNRMHVMGMAGLHRRAKNLWLMILNGGQRLRQARDFAVTASGVCLCVFGTTLFYHLSSHTKPAQ